MQFYSSPGFTYLWFLFMAPCCVFAVSASYALYSYWRLSGGRACGFSIGILFNTFFGVGMGVMMLQLIFICWIDPLSTIAFSFPVVWCVVGLVVLLVVPSRFRARTRRVPRSKRVRLKGGWPPREVPRPASPARKGGVQKVRGYDLREATNDNSEAICMICSNPVKLRAVILICPHCGGSAHRGHMLKWLQSNTTCPLCRRELR
jgi:hypothetical protein